jgi:hypothetical protein
MMNDGWIKIHRQIKEWQHYQEPNVVLVWLDLLTSANTKDAWWHGRKIRRGELFTSVESIHQNTGLDVKTIRKALATLEASGEIKREATNAGSKIIINQYNKFQSWGNTTQPLPQQDTQPLPQQDTQPLPQRLPHQQEYKNINKLKIQERKEGEGDAPAREEFLEPFGLLHNVNIAPEQHRHLVEGYGQEATDATIDDLSCKLADGTVDSSNHYATLLSWLRYQRRNGGIVPLSSSKADPMTEREKTLRIAWDATSEEGRQEYLEDHEGLLPWEYERKHQQS